MSSYSFRNIYAFYIIAALFISSCTSSKDATVQSRAIPLKIEKVEDLPENIVFYTNTGNKQYYQKVSAPDKPPLRNETLVLNSGGQVIDKTGEIRTVEEEHKKEVTFPSVYDPVSIPVNSESKLFNIVSGSFRENNNAALLAKDISALGFHNVSIIYSQNLYRVIVEKFDSESNARKFLKNFKSEHPEFSDAWLYIANK